MLRICTWNIKGSHSPIKRRKVLQALKKEGVDIALLQETHLNDSEHLKLQQCGFEHVFFSSFTNKSRGVAILVKNSVPFKVIDCTKDENGRYVLVRAMINGEEFAILNVYFPPGHPINFLTGIMAKLMDLSLENVIVGGDFNCLKNPLIDRLPISPLSISGKSKQIFDLFEEAGFVDVWRKLHPAGKEYTFYSNPHKCHTRIDYFFLPKITLGQVASCKIGHIVISDHAAVYLNYTVKNAKTQSNHWRLNPSILKDEKFVEYFRTEFKQFLAINSPSASSPSLLWDTAKAFSRGLILSYMCSKKRRIAEQQNILERKLKLAEEEYIKKPSQSKLGELNAIRCSLNTILTQNATDKVKFAKQRLFEHGDKPGRYLSYLTRARKSSQSIASISDQKGSCSTNPEKINAIFFDFYKNLYQSEQCDNSQSSMETFFSKIKLPILPEDKKNDLNAEISEVDVERAIRSLQGGKAPGPDGLTSEFYKTFMDLLSKPYLSMLNDSLDTGVLPPSLREANISLILKKSKPPENCGSYRPISLLNVDLKILSKILAKRLENILPLVIGMDQTGFIKGRNSCNNLRRLLNVIQLCQRRAMDGLVVSLDAEKAFDRVEWPFLFYTLHQFGLGPNFISWIKVLYSRPLAAVITNGLRSNNFEVGRGNRQGCPLSPLLFTLAIEPLAETIRGDPAVTGINTDRGTHKISLYADDVLLFLSRPVTSVERVITIINQFGSFSGYKINFSKSEAMPLGGQLYIPSSPFKWSPAGFKYLGISVTPFFDQMFKTNFLPLFEKIKLDLERWSGLPISWLGRISLLKMNILPRLLYPIRMIPILFTQKWIQKLKSWFGSFIWAKRRAFIKMSTLQLPRDMGGLDLPDLKKYQVSALILYAREWISDNPSTVWLDVEASLCDCPLKSLLFLKNMKTINKFCNNPITVNTVKAWRTAQHIEGRTGRTSSFTPFFRNPDFLPGMLDAGFGEWVDKGISSLGCLFKEGILMSFNQVVEAFGVGKNNLFRFFQLRDFIKKETTLLRDSEVSGIEKLLTSTREVSLSLCYKTLKCHKHHLPTLAQAWGDELGIEITDEMWNSIWNSARKISICNRSWALQLKLLHRAHLAPNRVSKFKPGSSSLCPKCKIHEGNLTHCLWSCPKIQLYWVSILAEIRRIIKTNIDLDPVSLLLGLPNKHIQNQNMSKLYNVLTFCARKNILLQWISNKSPTIFGWKKHVLEYIPLDFLTCLIHSKTDTFVRIWKPFLDYAEGHVSTILSRAFTNA
uniref:Reverse transcriptase domain-containing protein n=1 Tax=Kryptolebias marmoratus TaxID=37003 RepID=A0A3Q3G8L9_KRYMA